jgi:hypothetical protein
MVWKTGENECATQQLNMQYSKQKRYRITYPSPSNLQKKAQDSKQLET